MADQTESSELKSSKTIVVVSDESDLHGITDVRVVTADHYLDGAPECLNDASLIVNLCRATSYGSKGYYVSLLADARGQTVLPSVQTLAGLAEPYVRFRALQEAGAPTIDAAEMTVRRRMFEESSGVQTLAATHGHFPAPLLRDETGSVNEASPEEMAETLLVFGRPLDARFESAARAVYREWTAPLLRIQVVSESSQWKITGVAAASPDELTLDERGMLLDALRNESFLTTGTRRRSETMRASLAVLVDEGNAFSPSSPETIDRLERVGAQMGLHVARLGLSELRRLPEYDALFVRAHTSVTHPAFQFAMRAEALGMPVIDAVQSTIRCTNKVYIDELLKRSDVATPRTHIISRQTKWSQITSIGLPFVLKLPDGDFSAAVHKIHSHDDFECFATEMFEKSPLLLAQEWLPTKFDWRIGVLGGRLLFAAKYHMADGHWQIRTVEQGKERYGRVEAVAREQAPRRVVEVALKAAQLIGDGFYGVDIKEGPNGPVIIEINDNANLDFGYEDTADGDVIYEDIVRYFTDKIEAAAAKQPLSPGESYRAFEVAGVELEYTIVDGDLNAVSLVEPAFKALAGERTADVEIGEIGFSNEFADHVFELKTLQPRSSMLEIEGLLHDGVRRFNAVLRDNFGARLLPTAMHPWFDPRSAKLWTLTDENIYATYARLFDVHTHGWMNVQASHLNLPFGSERETMAMLAAASLLIPYLPAVAASSPVHDGTLQESVDGRLAFLNSIQARIPESCGPVVPEYSRSYVDYQTNILQPMYEALDRQEDAECIRDEFFNTRAAILRFSRKALELRVLDTQECVKMDVAIACFARWCLKDLTENIVSKRLVLPDHSALVSDFQATVRDGSRARVRAPHVRDVQRDDAGYARVTDVLDVLLDGARSRAPVGESVYLNLVERIVESGTLSEKIRARLAPHADHADDLRQETRRLYTELADCLEANEPWSGRWQ